jgi:hypothetical protein
VRPRVQIPVPPKKKKKRDIPCHMGDYMRKHRVSPEAEEVREKLV